ncbi:dynein heavy chain 6 [Salpingoeca rosetta]|uniref:Dynein heavy chain 6 n=1 Tax=Salpingoeca rosetta (strain ATCC 50818 / BSB-021) TaxID=946362 RepID=F2U1T2_SALR5|nr:dynein heavy chain 6 [Salpingoeca rosetta]EGD81584.1 dynein heavy chain 6 [Salpingoeca rosetta]|eukprot:XP_004996788.1 dynein heavy chain 6 [Salpingoeca rosetta]
MSHAINPSKQQREAPQLPMSKDALRQGRSGSLPGGRARPCSGGSRDERLESGKQLASRLHQASAGTQRTGTFKARKPPSLKSTSSRGLGRSLKLPPVPSAPEPMDVAFSHHAPLPPPTPPQPQQQQQQQQQRSDGRMAAEAASASLPSATASAGTLRRQKQQQQLAARASTDSTATAISDDVVDQLRDKSTSELIDFVKQGGARVGFLYLVPRDPSKVDRNVYDLKPVRHAEIRPGDSFFTLSVEGVTQIDGKMSTFTPLDRFEREFIFHSRLRQLPIFFKYRMWKAFTTWRNNIVQARQLAHTEELSAHLFLHHDILRPALMQIRAICLDVVDMRLVDIDPRKPYTVEQFFVRQREKCDAVTAKLQHLRRQVIDIALDACRRTMEDLGFSVVHLSPTPPPHTHTHMRLICFASRAADANAKMTYTEQARKRANCIRLAAFLRLIDMLVANAMQQLSVESVGFLRHYLEHLRDDSVAAAGPADEGDDSEAKRKAALAHQGSIILEEEVEEEPVPEFGPSAITVDDYRFPVKRFVERELITADPDEAVPLFKIDLLLDVDALDLDPDNGDVKHELGRLITSFKERVCAVEPIAPSPHFDFVTRPTLGHRQEDFVGEEPGHLAEILEEDERLAEHSEGVMDLLDFAYRVANKFKGHMSVIRDMYARSHGIDLEWLEETEHSLEFYTQSLEEFSKMITTGSGIVPANNLGMMVVDCRQLKETFLPVPRACLEALHRALPKLACRKNKEVAEQMHGAMHQLEMQPTTTEEYVRALTFVDEIDATMETIEKDAKLVTDLYALIDRFGIEAPPEDVAEFETAKNNIIRLRDTVKAAVDEQNKRINSFCDVLDEDISKLSANVLEVREEASNELVFDPQAELEKVLAFTRELNQKMETLQQRAAEYRSYQKKFKIEVTRFSALEETHAEVKAKKALWDTIDEWNSLEQDWAQQQFLKMDAEEMSNTVTRMAKAAYSLTKQLPQNEVSPQLQLNIEKMKAKMPVIMDLRNPALRPRHWEKIFGIIGQTLPLDDTLNLGMLSELDVFKHGEEIQEVSSGASSEASLEVMLKKVEDAWKEAELPVIPFRDSKDVTILGGMDDIQMLLDDSQVNIATIAGSRHVEPIRQRVEDWQRQLNLFSETVDEWLECQRSWIYLESIFSAPDIQRQLPSEAKMFLEVDKSFKDAMRKTTAFPNAIRAGTTPGFLERFKKNNALLEQIQKCLEDYLESKRMVFSRFFFLSNDELLEILAQTRNPQAVQPHLRKCFDAIQKLEFGEDGKTANDIYAMISPEGERVALGKGLKARGNVEVWLCSVEDAMVKSLYALTKAAITDYTACPRTEWVGRHPSQVIISVSQMMWCRDVTRAITNENPQQALEAYEKQCISQLADLAAMSRQKLSKLFRKVLGALITIDVHARDNVTSLVHSKVSDLEDFEWVRQLRYYWEDDIDDMVARMSNSRFVYAYEYLGASMRLVITPLTDRCYLCLMGALQLDLGGAPAGPAGTGKTETTKDMAKALGNPCIVFNCSEGLDYRMMGKFFSGLAQSGAWCCFDEFNRIDIEVLSVIAQQILTIKNAKTRGAKRFMFEGREIRLIPKCAAFITMNPGYAGRTELPDNLKALFRPFAMMVPDYALIAEVILFSEGFESPRNLARKMTQMYKLCSEQLSQQDHYDFGMRAVKSVLVMAGSLKRSRVGQSEATVLLTALRDSNLPKFLAEDVALFTAILSDLFPGVELPEHDYGSLRETIVECIEERELEVENPQVTKVIQLYETMVVRHGVMLVGPTGGGKSTVLAVLADTLTRLHDKGVEHFEYRPVHQYILNPKAVSMGELYGQVDGTTGEWRDGLMATLVRQCVAQTNDDHKWIVCDGPVDALWIENMNTVLDDNKMLCLANSERIKLSSSMHMLFEVADLAVASPATVSRCGMVYVDPQELGWRPYVNRWMHNLDILQEPQKEHLNDLFAEHVDSVLHQVHKTLREGIAQVDMAKASALCVLLEDLLREKDAQGAPRVDWSAQEQDEHLNAILSNYFLFAFIWSVGGNLVDQDHLGFDALVRDSFSDRHDIRIPGQGTVFDYYVALEANTPALLRWADIVPKFAYKEGVPFFDMLVPTSSTVKFKHLLERFSRMRHSVLFTGTTGVGKSVIAKEYLDTAEAAGSVLPLTMNFSAQTSSQRTQEIIESKLEKKPKNRLGPPMGKHMLLFVDDLNMPKLETYGAQPPIELLRQLQDYDGFYDRAKLTWTGIVDLTLIAACAPPGGGRNPTTPRLLRHFAMMCLPSPDEDTLKGIFEQITRGFFTVCDFQKEVIGTASAVVNAAVGIYERMSTDLLPTPAKSHYVFNLRDLSKCIQGILQVDSSVVRTPDHVFDLFCHECSRVFHDRLINAEDKGFFNEILAEMAYKHFNKNVEAEQLATKPVLFGDFMKMGAPAEDRLYEPLDQAKLPKVLEDYLDDYNLSSQKEMKLVFFQDAIAHVARIARMIRQPRGNALLVGVGGTGKQSLTRMACHMAGFKCFQIEITRGYGYSEFREDLKKLYELAGSKGEQTVFLFTDTQIVVEEFLEDINNMLNSGEVPNLIENDEIEQFLQPVRPLARQAGISESRDAVFQYFINRVRDNLHIVLCMSPVGDAFRSRCRMFPSIVNCCTIDWFTEWPREALLGVAQRFFEFVDLGDESLKGKIAQMCVEIHTSVSETADRFYEELRRKYYTTPTSYLELINLYTGMLDEKKRDIMLQRDRFQTGLNKLEETNDLVATMEEELTALEPVLKQQSEDTMQLMERIKVDKAKADEVRKVVKAEEAVAQKEANETEAIKMDAQRDLDEALPALQAATDALKSLRKEDVQELKAFASPPALVQTVMEAVCLLFGRKTDWKTAKSLLGEADFLKQMMQYDKDNIPDRTLKKIKPYIDNPDFVPEKVEKVSKACRSICMWVRAMDKYAHVFRTVEPKREKLKAAQAALNKTMAELKTKQDRLAEVEGKIKALQKQYKQSVAAKEELERNMERTAARLSRAGKLQTALADEQVRWAETVKEYDQQVHDVVGNVFLAAACVAYFGAFTSSYRADLVSGWVAKCKELEIPVTEGMGVADVLSSPFQIRQWNASGLPRDQLSTENAVLVTCGRRWPLMIDPQDQANKWIRQMEARNGLHVIKLTDPNFLRTLENAIRIGQPVLLEEVEETLDPSLEPILLKQTFKQGGRTLIRLGDSDIDYDKNFRFYMTTKMANPHYLPEICIKVTIINFTVTKTGLEDQLLADVVRLERPDLEEERTKLILQINEDRAQLKSIEDEILKLLFNSEGNILDDERLINTLNDSKTTSTAIGERLKRAETTEASITEARDKYRPAAVRGSVLFFVIADMSNIDPMYQYSLEYFKQLFVQCIEASEKASDLDTRLRNIISYSTENVFANVSRGLFERHKLMFSFMMCIEILRVDGTVTTPEWNHFLRGSGAAEREYPPIPEHAAAWLQEHVWHECCDLETAFPDVFAGLGQDLVTVPMPIELGSVTVTLNLHAGDTLKQGGEPSKAWAEALTPFQKLMVIRALVPHRAVEGVAAFVSLSLGRRFVESPPVSMQALYNDMLSTVPLIFVLSVGSDPMSGFLRFAQEKSYSDRVHSISLGQGQGPVAEKLIEKATRNGDWVFLQNCHLAKSWMTRMEQVIKGLADPKAAVHDDFRLFLSSAPCSFFPVSVLQNSVKVTNEPPKGLKANLRGAFASIEPSFFEKHKLGTTWRKLIFGLCFFHAVIQERKKFRALGWNIPYEFSSSDRECALENLRIFLEDGHVPWSALFFITSEITYGGRVTDRWDERCLSTILRRYLVKEALDADYKYSPSGTYYAPAVETIEQMQEYVDSLPFSDDPEVFGMHDNANIAFQLEETNMLVRTILDVQPRMSGGASGKTPDEIVFELAGSIEEKLPKALLDIDEAKPGTFDLDEQGRVQSLSTVLRQEVDRFNKLLVVLWDSLSNIKKAIKGLVVMSAELERVYTSFLNNQVPEMWATAAYPSLKPLASWVKDLVLRLEFVEHWLKHGKPKSFWLSGFFFPQGFLTGTLQTHARKYNLPIDTLSFQFEVLPHVYIEEGAKDHTPELPHFDDGVLVHGIFMDAFRWDDDAAVVSDSLPGQMQAPLPVMHMLPTANFTPPPKDYIAPLYKTSVRAGVLSTTGHSTNFVVAVHLPSTQPQDYWIAKGAALLCQLDS